MSNNVHIDNFEEKLKISDAAKLLGVSTKTLRRWEAKGIIKADRSPTGNRVYTKDHLDKILVSKKISEPLFLSLIITTIFSSIIVTSANNGFKVLQNLLPIEDAKSFVAQKPNQPTVLAAQTTATDPTVSNFTFAVNVPAKFSDKVTFTKNITAPNVVNSVNGGVGDVTLKLTAGDGISVDGLKVTNKGILSLAAGDGISIDGNKITNSIPQVDLTDSGWTTGTGTVYLTTSTDHVGIGTSSPTVALDVAGSVILGSTNSDSITINGGISAGSSIIPSNDLGADLGSSSKRFNNVWVANLNSNSSQSFSGQATFSYAPTDSTLSQGSVIINPTTSAGNGQLLGLGIAGYQRASIDSDGNIILSYNGLTSAPVTYDPITVYDHGTTRVHIVDDNGNGYFAGKLGVGIDATNSNINGLFEVHEDQNAGTYSTVSNYNNTSGAVAGFYADNYNTRLWLEAYSPNAGGIYNNAAYIHTNDSSQPLYFGNSGVGMALVAGQVGIGTTSPSSALQVNGVLTLKNGSNSAPSLVSESSSSFGMNFTNGNSQTSRIDFRYDGTYGANIYAKTINQLGGGETVPFVIIGGYGGGPDGMAMGNNSPLAWVTTSRYANGTQDLYLWPEAAATLQMGIDSATPVSQIFKGSDSRSGTDTNIAGGDMTIAAGRGTGTGGGGKLYFQTAPAGSTGTTANTLTTRLTIDNGGLVGIGTTSPTSLFHVTGKVTGKALGIFDETGDQAIFTASASGVPKVTIDHSGQLGIGTSSPLSLFQAGKMKYDDSGIGTLTVGGDSANTPNGNGTINAKILSNVAAINMTQYGTYIAIDYGTRLDFNVHGTTTMSWYANNPANQSGFGIGTTSPTTLFHVTGAKVGKALSIFDETGNQSLLTASASGTPKFTVMHNGLVDATIGVATFTKAGTISDSDFTDGGLNGTLAFDSTDGRLYIRNAGAWSYIAKTAGFQIPDFESAGLSEGDYLIPYVEKKMSDGAVHGLYSKWSDVKDTLLAEVNLQITNLKLQITNFADKFKTKEICLTGDNNTETCIKKDQLDNLIKLLPSSSPTAAPVATPAPTDMPTATPEATVSPTPTDQPSPTP